MENKCDGCKHMGMCCYRVLREGVTLYILPSLPCQYLGKDMRCTVFERRHEVNPECATMEEVAKLGGVPSKCNYRFDYDFRYKDVRIASPKTEKRLLKKLRKKLNGVYTSQ